MSRIFLNKLSFATLIASFIHTSLAHPPIISHFIPFFHIMYIKCFKRRGTGVDAARTVTLHERVTNEAFKFHWKIYWNQKSSPVAKVRFVAPLKKPINCNRICEVGLRRYVVFFFRACINSTELYGDFYFLVFCFLSFPFTVWKTRWRYFSSFTKRIVWIVDLFILIYLSLYTQSIRIYEHYKEKTIIYEQYLHHNRREIIVDIVTAIYL